ncbi:hypothetical protein PR048_001685 [Dryococelus australis]|uniref:HAT C-terminal dimerisation domain-containing protein n=1 Tax=Dryococelus australis TaxID=614101 RepID=A0ABQ9II64_9NEOP|nr:hypothetical protein PR048_001685 [Dryococelus australis]
MEEKMDIYELEPPMFPRKRIIQENLEYSASSSENFNFTMPKHRFKAIYFETLDTFVGNLERFKLPGFERIPVTSATAECLFSLLKRLKSYLRSAMTQERLNHLAILHCYQDMVDKIDVKVLCREFYCNTYRVSVFEKAFE